MELLELLLSLPDLLAFLYYVFKGLWWLLRGIVTLFVLIGLLIVDAGRAIGRGVLRLGGWLRDRERARDFPTASVVVDRGADRGADRGVQRTDRAGRRDDAPVFLGR